MMRNTRGFTLLEIILVIGIIAILAWVLIPKSTLFRNMALDAGVESNQHSVEALVTQMIYDWGSSGYTYADSAAGANQLELDLKTQINNSGTQADSDLENPATGEKGMAAATRSGSTVTSFPGGAVAYVAGGDNTGTEWPSQLAALKGVVGVSAYYESSRLKIRIVAYDTAGSKYHDEILIIRH